MIRVYKHVNGIALNGREYLLDGDNQVMIFSSAHKAIEALAGAGIKSNNEDELNSDYDIFLERITYP